LKELQLIQILSIKNFGRAVPLLAAKIAPRINRLIGGANAARRAHGTPKRTRGLEKGGEQGRWRFTAR
jgi:hypothetical protein